MQGLKIIFTGNGKGKTTAAIGAAVRFAGQGFKVKIIQFIKDSKFRYGEHKTLEMIPNIEIESFGKGFIGILGDRKTEEEHKIAALKAFEALKKDINSDKYNMIIADEILGAIFAKLIDEKDVEILIKKCPKDKHLILTGRNASRTLIDLVDTVTEMKEIKHHYQNGLPPYKGIEY
ncbi:MAG: cob(I)yrinic acid a,c-diamide adenosyltransferase [Patescibacteria group bacterium]